MKSTIIEDIARDIESYINTKVTYISDDNVKWKTHYNEVIEELKSEIERTKTLINEYSDENLTVNRIEREGFLRGLITMLNEFERWKPKSE